MTTYLPQLGLTSRLVLLNLLAVVLCTGCVSIEEPGGLRKLARLASLGTEETVVLREVKPGPIRQAINMVKAIKPVATDRSLQTLRRYALYDDYQKDRGAAIDQLWSYAKQESNSEISAAVAQLAIAEGQYFKDRGDRDRSAPWFLLAMASANDFLWEDKYQTSRNIYDPLFREVSDIYNKSLKSILFHLKDNKSLDCNSVVTLKSRGFECELSIRSEVGWKKEDFEKFEFASDYQINGLTNKHYQYGLGVPLIAVLKNNRDPKDPAGKYYPPGLTIPLTAFMKVDSSLAPSRQSEKKVIKASVHFVDPLKQKFVWIGGRQIPLEIDISTPLAYYLNDPLYRSNLLATAFLIDADLGKQARGLYMLEPYDPNKIPVVMVHGFWSSALTWTEMFNDLRAQKELQSKYQFWFYMYPTGQPFWVSAQHMREDLAELRQKLDPKRDAPALDEMVLVGHSMGGLISLLQTVDSEDHFWNVISEKNINQIQGDPESIAQLKKTFYFKPNRSIKRVVTLGTPHKGSDFANSTTRWLGHKLLNLPKVLISQGKDLLERNPNAFKKNELLTIQTSIDSLSPDSPFFDALQKAKPSPWTQYHNVFGNKQSRSWSDSISSVFFGESEGDGVVKIENAQLPYAKSEDEVDAEHMEIHIKPKSIWIVRQVLLQHLEDTNRRSINGVGAFAESRQSPKPWTRPQSMAQWMNLPKRPQYPFRSVVPLHLAAPQANPTKKVSFLQNKRDAFQRTQSNRRIPSDKSSPKSNSTSPKSSYNQPLRPLIQNAPNRNPFRPISR